MINWDDADYKAAGHFYTVVNKVTITCTNAQTVAAGSNITSYVYGGTKDQSKTPTILYSNHSTLLGGAGRSVPALGLRGIFVSLLLGTLLGINALLL